MQTDSLPILKSSIRCWRVKPLTRRRMVLAMTEGTHVAEIFRFVEIELIVIPLAAPLQRYELFVVLRD